MRTALCAEGLFEPTRGIYRYLELWPPSADDPVTLLFGVRRAVLPAHLGCQPNVEIHAFMPGRGLRDCPALRYERKSYSQICQSFRGGTLRPDALIAVAGEPSPTGTRSLGVVSGYLQLAAESARRIVVEEMPGLAAVAGAATVRAADVVVPAPPPADFQPLTGQPDETSRRIAAHIASLLRAPCTLALGAGKVADAVVSECTGMKGLRLVTGALGEAAYQLAQAGAIHPTASVLGMSVLGGPHVTSWAARDRRVRLLPSTLIHQPAWLAAHDHLIVVLGALAVDRAGNVNSERAAGRTVSGLGGAPDFAAGAAASRGGRCIVALPSADRSGNPALKKAVDTVSVPAAHVDAIVTEKGVAVKGTSLRRWASDLERIF